MPPKEEETTMDESMIEEAEGITYEGIFSCKMSVNNSFFRSTQTDECNCHTSRFKEALQAYLQMLEESCQGQNLPQKRSQGLFSRILRTLSSFIFKDVIKYVKKGEKGFAVLAGDTFPIDVYW